MTDYTSIADSQIDPKAPVTSELMTALRDNPIAIAEGAAGAPKIADKVIYEDTVVSSWVTVTGLGDFSGCLLTSILVFRRGPRAQRILILKSQMMVRRGMGQQLYRLYRAILILQDQKAGLLGYSLIFQAGP